MFGTIQEAVKAILFFGTPHSGTYAESYANILALLGLNTGFSSLVDELVQHFRVSLSVRLQESAPVLTKLNEAFCEHAYCVPTVSFVEDVPLPGLDKIVRSQA
jgi:hypothetical protein